MSSQSRKRSNSSQQKQRSTQPRPTRPNGRAMFNMTTPRSALAPVALDTYPRSYVRYSSCSRGQHNGLRLTGLVNVGYTSYLGASSGLIVPYDTTGAVWPFTGGTVSGGAYPVYAVRISPFFTTGSEATLFRNTFVDTISTAFLRYITNGFRIIHVSSQPTSTAGSITLCIVDDGAAGPPTAPVALYQNESVTVGNVWNVVSTDRYTWPKDSDLLYIEPKTASATAADDRQAYAGTVMFAGTCAASQPTGAIGLLFAEFDFELYVMNNDGAGVIARPLARAKHGSKIDEDYIVAAPPPTPQRATDDIPPGPPRLTRQVAVDMSAAAACVRPR